VFQLNVAAGFVWALQSLLRKRGLARGSEQREATASLLKRRRRKIRLEG
jgi:hypothetical protein